MAVTEVTVQGENGAVCVMQVPEAGHRRELFDQLVAQGRLTILDGTPPATVEEAPESPGGDEPPVKLPGKSAPKAVWVDAAVAAGMDPGAAQEMTVAQLRVALGADED